MASFLGEIKRRKVFQVAAVYAVVAWLLVQIVATVEAPLNLPDWVDTLVIVLLAVGFPIAAILAWVFDIKSSGIERTAHAASVDSSPAETMPAKTGLAINLAVVGVLSVILVIAGSYIYLQGGLAGTAADGSDIRSIAVLPLTNQSAAGENAEFFAAGIHDQLLTQLARIGSLKVISRTSVMEYADTTKNMRDIGAELGVATILEGSVQQAGNMVLMNVQLIDAQTDAHLWAQDYERELTVENIFAIQRETATAIAAALEAAILPEEAEHLSEVPTLSRPALDYYLSGNNYFWRPDDWEYLQLALQQYQRAVDEDPNFALAWTQLGSTHSLIYWFGIDRTESRLERALAALDRAFEIAPDLPEAHLARGKVLFQGLRDYDAALEEFALAEQGMPAGAPELLNAYAMIYRRIGRWDEAVDYLGRAIELDPRNLDRLTNQAGNYQNLRDYAAAGRLLDRILEIAPDQRSAHIEKSLLALYRGDDVASIRSAAANSIVSADELPPRIRWMLAIFERDYQAALEVLDSWDVDTFVGGLEHIPKASYYGTTYRLAGRDEEARNQFESARLQLDETLVEAPEDWRIMMSLAEALAELGAADDAIALARRALETYPIEVDTYSANMLQVDAITRVLIAAGDHDAAIQELDAFLSLPGRWSIEGLSQDPRLDPIRDDPRFHALEEKYGRN